MLDKTEVPVEWINQIIICGIINLLNSNDGTCFVIKYSSLDILSVKKSYWSNMTNILRCYAIQITNQIVHVFIAK